MGTHLEIQCASKMLIKVLYRLRKQLKMKNYFFLHIAV